MAKVTRRSALAALGAIGTAGAVGGLAYGLRRIFEADGPPAGGMMGSGMMGNTSPADMNTYMEMFNRHNEIHRVVEEIPGGVRTTTQSDAPDLAARLHAHVSAMYSHLQHGAEMTCMSSTLPTLFRSADSYRRHLALTATGVTVEETSDDPNLTQTIRAHAAEITRFVNEGMPAMMRGMMGPGKTRRH